jgi:hypothetical protein
MVLISPSALRKTAYLLTALSSALPDTPADASSLPAPITYHPLDLSRPELHRVLGEMDEAFGKDLQGKVDYIGLHGDYDAGLKFIRDGKLGSLSSIYRGRGFGLENVENVSCRSDSTSPESAMPVTPDTKPVEQSMLSPISDHLVTPGPDITPLPSSLDDSSCVSRCDTGSGTWSTEGEVETPATKPLELAPEEASAARSAFNSNEAKPSRPLHLVFLGSSLGNFPREAAAPFLRSLPLRRGDTLLLGLDGRPTPGKEGAKKVEVAYNDPAGHTRAFEEHGWDVVRQELGLKGDAGVEFVGRYNEEIGASSYWFLRGWVKGGFGRGRQS